MSTPKFSFGKDIKILLVGDKRTGKTCFINKWIKNSFEERYEPTTISDFAMNICQKGDILYKINLWELSGSEQSKYIISKYDKNIDGCIIFSSLINDASITNIKKWKEMLRSYEEKEFPIIIVGTKVDFLDESDIKEKHKELKEFLKNNYSYTKFFLTSSKTGKNINNCMEYLIKKIINKEEKKEENEKNKNSEEKSEKKEGENKEENTTEKIIINNENTNNEDNNSENESKENEKDISRKELFKYLDRYLGRGEISSDEKSEDNDDNKENSKIEEEEKEEEDNKRLEMSLNDDMNSADNIEEMEKEKKEREKKAEKRKKKKFDIDFEDYGDEIKVKIFKEENSKINKYSCYLNINALKEKYNLFKSIDNGEELINILKSLKEQKRIKIKSQIEKIVVELCVIFTNLAGEKEKMLFDLLYEGYNEDDDATKVLFDEFVKVENEMKIIIKEIIKNKKEEE